MATSRAFMEFLLDQFSELPDVTCRPMMGEYVLYYRGKVVGDVCDGRLLVKPVPAACAMLPDAPHEPPYPGAKDMLLVENVDDREALCALLRAMYDELPQPKPKRPRNAAKS